MFNDDFLVKFHIFYIYYYSQLAEYISKNIIETVDEWSRTGKIPGHVLEASMFKYVKMF